MEKVDLLQGTLDLLVMKILSVEAMHGYGIARTLKEISDELLVVEEGSLYPALYRMEKRGWIQSEWRLSEKNRRARYYKLTRVGRKQLADEEENWESFTKIVAKVMQLA